MRISTKRKELSMTDLKPTLPEAWNREDNEIFVIKRMFLSYLIKQFKKSHPEHFSHQAFADYYQNLVKTNQLEDQLVLFAEEKQQKNVQENPSLLQKSKTFIKNLFREKTPEDYQKIIADQLYQKILFNFNHGDQITLVDLYPLFEKCETTEFYLPVPFALGDFTPLTFACAINHSGLVYHLQKLNADVNFPDDDLNTPLNLSVRMGRYDIVQSLLLNKEIDKDYPDYKTGKTPLQEAVFSGYADIAGLLLRKGAKVEDRDELLDLVQHGKMYWISKEKKEDFEKRNYESVREVIQYYTAQRNEKKPSAEMIEKTTSIQRSEPVKISDQHLNQVIRAQLNFSREHA